MAGIQVVEAQFGEAANRHYEGLMDLNTPSAQIMQAFQRLMSMRDNWLNLYGVPTQPQPNSAFKAPAGKGAAGKGAAKGQQRKTPQAAAAAGAQDTSNDW